MITVLIVDDHPAVRLVIKTQLSQVLGVSSVLEADNGQAAIDVVRQCKPDLVILDLDIPKINGLEVILRLKAIQPGIRVLVISGQDPMTFAPRAMQVGAKGFVSKMQDMTDIMRCVESVLAGYTLFPAEVVESGAVPGKAREDSELLQQLTDKEIQIMQMLSKGMSNKAIGDSLFISNKTVSSHKTRIMEKLHVTTLLELIDFARRCNIAP
ncbi:response regulator [Cupriavidus metallidurans]